jgi:homoserine kinase
VEPAARLSVRATGEGSDLAADATHLAASVAIDVAGHDRLSITVRSDIPVARGLGSSAALAVAAAAAAGSRDPLGVAARVDGHPENAAASVVGGLVAATTVKGAVRAVRMPLDIGLVFVALVPERSLSTSKARQALPQQVSRTDATFNLGRLSLLLAGLADRSLLIREATEDRLHQDYRSPMFPEAPQLLARLVDAGALASCWSGAGPTLLGICDGADGDRVRAQAEALLKEMGVPGRAMILRPDLEGLVVDGGATGLFDIGSSLRS